MNNEAVSTMSQRQTDKQKNKLKKVVELQSDIEKTRNDLQELVAKVEKAQKNGQKLTQEQEEKLCKAKNSLKLSYEGT